MGGMIGSRRGWGKEAGEWGWMGGLVRMEMCENILKMVEIKG
jgi:hypothetical protein